MSTTVDAMIRAARAMTPGPGRRQTPFRHQGRVPGVGVDCAGVLAVAMKAAGIPFVDTSIYGRMPTDDALLAAMEANDVDRIDDFDALRPGDFVVFWINRRTHYPQHVGLVSDRGLIHAWYQTGVVENGLDDAWRRRFVAGYRLRRIA